MKRVLIILLALLSLSLVPATSHPVHAAGPVVIITIIDYRFVPDYPNVTTGTTVIWNNTGAHPHNVTSIGDVTFQSSPYTLQPYPQSGHTYSLDFNVPSVYRYDDGLYPSMTGIINVTGAPVNSGGGSGGNNGGGSGGSGGGGSGGSGGGSGGSTPANSVTTGYFVPAILGVILVAMPLAFIVYRRLSQKPPSISGRKP